MDEGESPWTEITIQPDGRVYVFGMSRDVLEVISRLPTDDPTLRMLWEQLRMTEQDSEVTTGRVQP